MAIERISILLIDTNPECVDFYRKALGKVKDFSFTLEYADTLAKGLDIILVGETDLVLLDLSLADISGIDATIKLHTLASSIPIIILADPKDEPAAIKTLNQGAQDYLIKGRIDSKLLVRSIHSAIKCKQIENDNQQLKSVVKDRTKKLIESNKQLHEKLFLDNWAQEKMVDLTSFYRNILDGMISGVWVSDRDDVIYYINKGMAEIARMPPEKILGIRVLKDLPEEMLKFFKPLYLQAKQTLQPVYYKEIPVMAPSGKQCFHSGWLIPRVIDNTFHSMICTVEDVTERKRAEEDLRVSEDRFRNIIDSANIMIWGCYADGHIKLFNKESERVMGYSQEEALTKHFLDFHPPEEREQVLEKFKRHKAGKLNKFLELGIYTKEGKRLDGLLAQATFKDRLGNDFLVALVQDITKRKEVEKELNKHQQQLEALVKERTAKLSKLNANLKQEISERQWLEKLLSCEKNNFVSILNAMEDGVYIVSQNYDIEYINSAMEREFGPPEGKKCYQYFHDRKAPCDSCKNEEVFEGKTFRWEWYCKKSDKTYECMDTPLQNPDGSTSVLKTVRNITERKQIECELFKREKELEIRNRMAEIFLTVPDEKMFSKILKLVLESLDSKYGTFGYFDQNRDGAFVVPSLTQNIWWEKCNVLDKEFVFKRGTWGGLWAQAIKERKSFYSNNGSFKTPEGHIPIQNTMVVPIIYHNKLVSAIHIANKPGGYDEKDQALLESIAEYIAPILYARLQKDKKETERKLAKDKLHRKIEELEIAKAALKQQAQIINHIHDAVVMTDLGGYVTFWNRGARKLFGYTAKEALTRHISFLCLEEDRDNIRERMIIPLQEKGHHEVESTQLKKSGEEVIIHLSLSLAKDFQNKIIGMIGYAMDITERKRAEAMLKERQKEVEDLNANLETRVQEELEKNRQKDSIMMQQARMAAMGEMIGHIAHQWRQPLNTLNLVIYNIKDLFENDMLHQRMLDDLTSKGISMIKKMSTTIDDFRNFFKPNKQKEVFSINDIIENSLSLLEPSFKHNNISVKLNADKKIKTIGIANEYSQAVLNILNNAKDAIAAKGDGGEIVIEIFEDDQNATLKIRDSGGGISDDIIGNIFKPYFTSKTNADGTGLGLYLTKIIIEDHMNGSIQAENIGDGAEFKIITPIKRQEDKTLSMEE